MKIFIQINDGDIYYINPFKYRKLFREGLLQIFKLASNEKLKENTPLSALLFELCFIGVDKNSLFLKFKLLINNEKEHFYFTFNYEKFYEIIYMLYMGTNYYLNSSSITPDVSISLYSGMYSIYGVYNNNHLSEEFSVKTYKGEKISFNFNSILSDIDNQLLTVDKDYVLLFKNIFIKNNSTKNFYNYNMNFNFYITFSSCTNNNNKIKDIRKNVFNKLNDIFLKNSLYRLRTIKKD